MWDLNALRTHIGSLDAERTYLIDVVNSIGRANHIFRYHLSEARDAFKGIVDDEDPAGPASLEFILGGSDRQSDFNLAKLSSEANLVACMHTVRNQCDIFGQLVNGLVLEAPMSIGFCSISRVCDRLPSSRIKDELISLLNTHWFSYVNGFINTAKHRKLIQHGFSVSFQEDRSGVKLGMFKYGGQTYPSHWGSEVLQGVVDLNNSLVACGRTLNSACLSGSDA